MQINVLGMRSSQVNIRNLFLHKLVLPWVAWKSKVEVVSSMEAIQRVAASALRVELPKASVTASTPDLSVGEECRKADLDTAMAEDTKSLDL
jgi:hypothetical protein